MEVLLRFGTEEQKKKWLLISYLLLAGVIYFLILKDKPFSFNLF
jgi:hypothetical protein